MKVRGWNQIDAIGISQSVEPIHAYIRLAQDAPKADKVIRENLGRGVNSRHGELAPVIAHDGKTLYYTRAMVDRFGGIKAGLGIKPNEDQDIFVSTMLQNGRWSKAKNMGSPINNKDKNAIFSVSADGREVLLMNKYLPDLISLVHFLDNPQLSGLANWVMVLCTFYFIVPVLVIKILFKAFSSQSIFKLLSEIF